MVVAIAQPSGAQEEWEPIFNTERTYVHCGADKVTANEHVTYAWDTTEPTTSFTADGGCGSLDSTFLDGDGETFTGKHAGNLDQLTVHAWMIDCCRTRAVSLVPEIWVDVSVQIDGSEVVFTQTAEILPIPSETGISRLVEFSVTDIDLLTEADYKEHDVSVSLETASVSAGDEVGWVLDASEVQSGVTFSPTTLAAHRIPADW